MANLLTLRTLERRFVKAYLRWGKQKRPPIAINVEPTNICNLACPICPHGAQMLERKRARGYLAMDTFEHILNECERSHIRIMALYLHGEPFLHPQFPDLVTRATERGVRVNIMSNGLPVRPEQVEQTLKAQPKSLILSMDLISRAGYIRYKGRDHFDEAWAQLQMIASIVVRMRSKTRLAVRTIYNGESQADLAEFLVKGFEIPGLETIQLTHAFPWPEQTDADILANRVTARPRRECSQVWNALNICWDGTVTPCSYDYEAAYPIGHILEASLNAILNSRAARHFRRMHILERQAEIPLCATCLVPRFAFEIITLKRPEYLAMDHDERQKFLDRIRQLSI